MGVLSEIQLIGKALQEAGKIELYTKLLEIQEKTLEVQEENRVLKERILHLSEELKIKGNLRFGDKAYYLKIEGSKEDGPFCSSCWDAQKKLIRLHKLIQRFWCPVCKNFGPSTVGEDDKT